MLLEVVIFFLALSMVFYVLFAGADFGAGALELISGRQDRETIAHAISPVWEANHVWLILVVVILFMGFPKIYAAMSLYLHIPLLLMLVGIILRGTAFTFMHYDAIQDGSDRTYNAIFKFSSMWTPLFLGIIIGALVLGRINPDAATFFEAYLASWLNLFSFAVGLFCLVLFTFLAAVYLIGETTDIEQRSAFIRVAWQLNGASVISGGLVFAAAQWNGLPLWRDFMQSPVALMAVIFAAVLLPLLWRSLHYARVAWSRILAATQVVMILLAWFWVQYPVVVKMKNEDQALTFYNTAAPDETLLQLVVALVVGACIILPFLYFLMNTFKGKQFTNN
ncbi:cytochrome d ubiquinol oxidase subunit II [Fodinibius sediminis]|uniref:Cytochrome bd-I ubiquinol oxidase subunit 2 apoprotein n=1 Tax=Fodinibius sediminis TaxID=1214077 RepID=A0A521F2Q4_9BACT|nr:cytochrome d ubiquinol oxidase subunit II [Fodinibius sediminis]SMO90387.1 cytochrome bd-I ubiquinol oxidase subunit 2 apoprotein [Fodinibius sediminis]